MPARTRTKHPGISKYETREGTRYRVVVDGGIDKEGKRRQLTRAGIATLAEAKRVRGELLNDNGRTVAGSVPFASFVARWLIGIEATVRPTTVARYEKVLNLYVLPVLGTRSVGEITPIKIGDLERSLLDRGLSTSTVRMTHVVMHRVFKGALRSELVERNPVAAVDPPALAGPVGKVWTAEECRRFLAASANDELGPLWALLLATSMRLGEALALQWRDVDFDAGTVAIRRTITRDRQERWTVGEPKTEKARRVVALGPVGVAALRALPRGVGGAYVFPARDGSFRRPQSAWRTFRAACVRRDLPVIRIHDLRHTAITRAIEAGVPLLAVSRRAGHSGIGITSDRYTHPAEAMDQSAANVLGEVLAG